jgi:hypothetical protein
MDCNFVVFSVIFLVNFAKAQNDTKQGIFFAKNHYDPHPLPRFVETKEFLPHPIYDENPLWVETYWKVWKLAFKNFHTPAEGSGFVSQFLDAALNANIFFWDTALRLVPKLSRCSGSEVFECHFLCRVSAQRRQTQFRRPAWHIAAAVMRKNFCEENRF